MAKSAYIIIDVQNDYFPNGRFPLINIKEASSNAAKFLEFVRNHNKTSGSEKDKIEIIHVRHEEVSPESPLLVKGTEGADINNVVKPLDDEVVVTKHQPNSFVDTKLGEILKDAGVDTLYISGAMANICIQGTVRHASEIGYKITTLKDAIGTRAWEYDGRVVDGEDVMAAVFATLAFGYSELKTTDEVIASLK